MHDYRGNEEDIILAEEVAAAAEEAQEGMDMLDDNMINDGVAQ